MVEWWLVGLCDSLASDEVADMVLSARSNRTSAMPRSSRANAPRSSRVFDENYEIFDDGDDGSTSSSLQ